MCKNEDIAALSGVKTRTNFNLSHFHSFARHMNNVKQSCSKFFVENLSLMLFKNLHCLIQIRVRSSVDTQRQSAVAVVMNF